MKIEELEKRLLAVADASQAQPMKAYMKNHFDFLGVRTPDRRKVARQFFKESKAQRIDWD
ncbi:DNA alkylation repair protein, partial [Streptococcus suis]